MALTATAYRYTFTTRLASVDVQETLVLALLAGEALHGGAQLRLDAAYRLDLPGRTCEIAADTRAGRDLNKLFTNFLRREFGEGAFRVERITAADAPAPQAAG